MVMCIWLERNSTDKLKTSKIYVGKKISGQNVIVNQLSKAESQLHSYASDVELKRNLCNTFKDGYNPFSMRESILLTEKMWFVKDK